MTTCRLVASISFVVALAVGLACGDPGSSSDGPADGGGSESSAEGTDEAGSGGSETSAAGTETGDSGTTGTSGIGGACEGGLANSFTTWEAMRDGVDGTYSFTMNGSVVINDHCSVDDVYIVCDLVTTLDVENNVVVGRSLAVTPMGDATADDCPEPYAESGEELGSHSDGYGIATVDDVYASCCDLAEMQGGYHLEYGDGYRPGDVAVTLDDDGLLERCTTQYCDDCGCSGSVGIHVGQISL